MLPAAAVGARARGGLGDAFIRNPGHVYRSSRTQSPREFVNQTKNVNIVEKDFGKYIDCAAKLLRPERNSLDPIAVLVRVAFWSVCTRTVIHFYLSSPLNKKRVYSDAHWNLFRAYSADKSLPLRKAAFQEAFPSVDGIT